MSTTPSYTAVGKVEKIEWEARPGYTQPEYAVAVTVGIPATQFAGLDITRLFTITQE